MKPSTLALLISLGTVALLILCTALTRESGSFWDAMPWPIIVTPNPTE